MKKQKRETKKKTQTLSDSQKKCHQIMRDVEYFLNKLERKNSWSIESQHTTKIKCVFLNENQELVYQLEENGQQVFVDRSYLSQKGLLEKLCEYYESGIEKKEKQKEKEKKEKEEEEQKKEYRLVLSENQSKSDQQDHEAESKIDEPTNKKQKATDELHLTSQQIFNQVIKLTSYDLSSSFRYDDPGLIHSFSDLTEEDKELLEAKKRGMSYEQIARSFPKKKTISYWSKRHTFLTKKDKYPWTKKQDDLIRALVEEYGRKWQYFQQVLASRQFSRQYLRTAHEIRARYNQMLLKKESWTLDMDIKLIALLQRYRKDWYQIARQMNISKDRVYTRYYRLITCAKNKVKKLLHLQKP